MHIDWNHMILFCCNIGIAWLCNKTSKNWSKAEKRYHVAELARINAAGELECLKKIIKEISPEILEVHESVLVQVHANIAANEGVKK